MMSKNQNKIHYITKSFILNFMIMKFILCELNECEREKPIKKGTQCLSTYCSNSQFDSGQCIVSNPIIKTQWLNNIILVGEKDYRYIGFITSSKGELLLSTSSYPVSRGRIFFGINSNGLPIFKDNNQKNVFIIKKTVKRASNYEKYETVLALIKINGGSDQNKEYLIDFGKSKTYTEIFDYIEYNKDLVELENSKTINADTETYIGSLSNYIEDEINYYFFSGIKKKSDTDYKIYLAKFRFTYDAGGNIKCNTDTGKNFDTLNKKIVNCHLRNNNILVCLFVAKNSKYKMVFLDTDLEVKKEQELSISSPSSSLIVFFKFLKYKDDICIFIYYQGLDNDYPIIQFI